MVKKLFFFATIMLSVTLSAIAKPDAVRYDIECAGEGAQGSYLVKVWVYAKSSKFTSDNLKHYAVHGVLFKGYAGKEGLCGSQKAMVTPALEHDRADFFDAFFGKEKQYARYATEVSGSIERIKVGKEYKYGMVVSIAKDALRKDLEAAGILRGLSSGF